MLLAVLATLVSFPALAGDGFHQLQGKSLQKKAINFAEFKGKPVLIVNTATGCGYTPQLGSMQKLHEKYQSRGLVVIGVPSNDFNQEAKGDVEIGEYCKKNYGVTFAMMEKAHVNGKERHPLYQYLVANSQNPTEDIKWNFEKFLVDADGKVVGRFSSSDKPDSEKITAAIETLVDKAKNG